MFNKGATVEVIFDNYLGTNDLKPPLILNQTLNVERECICKCGEIHVDVGIISPHNYVTCYKCGQVLPSSDTIYWCHSSRFKLIENDKKIERGESSSEKNEENIQ